MGQQVTIDPEVIVSGTPINVEWFEFSEPEGALGSQVTFSLTDPTATVGPTDTIKAQISINSSPRTLIKNAKTSGEANTTVLRGDKQQYTALNPIAQGWQIAPRNPVVLYDPAFWTPNLLARQIRDVVFDTSGSVILPILTAVENLSLYQVLQYVYVTMGGYGSVITNIADYPVHRVDFVLTSSYHQIAASLVNYFSPVMYADDESNTFYVIDPQAPLPPSIPVLSWATDDYQVSDKSQPVIQRITAILLSYKERPVPFTGPITTRVETEVQSTGTLGNANYQQTIVNRTFQQLHQNLDFPWYVTREVETSIETQTYGMDESGNVNTLLSQETQDDVYSPDYELKLSHTRVLSAALKTPGNPQQLIANVLTETQRTVWGRSIYNPLVYVKVWLARETSGLVLVEGDPLNPDQQTPLIDANRLKLVEDTVTGNQTVSNLPISSYVEFWRETGGGQVNIQVQETDHLAGVIKTPQSVDHIADNTINSDRDPWIVRRILVTDATNEADFGILPAIEMDAGEIPLEVAFPIAQRRLVRARKLQRRATVTLPCFDPSIKRGSLRNLTNRSDSAELMIVTGYTVRADQLGLPGANVSMRVEGILIDS